MPRLRESHSLRLLAWTAFWVFLIDQATKWLVVHWLDLRTQMEIDLLPPWVNLRMAWNRGVNFGLLADVDMRWALVALAVGISTFVVLWVRREGGSRLVQASAGLLVGGALGNVVDRVLYGAVADFLNMTCCGFENPWAFNVADVAVFLGALGLVLFAGRGNGREPRKAPAKPEAPAPKGGAKSPQRTESRPASSTEAKPAPKAERRSSPKPDGRPATRAARASKTG